MKSTFTKLSFFFCSISLLHAQTSGYVLVKTSASTYVASNPTSISTDFYLLLSSPADAGGLSVTGPDGSTLPSSSAPGFEGTFFGPFTVPRSSSVTLKSSQNGPAPGQSSFALLPLAKLGRFSILSLTPNPVPSPSNGSAERGLLRSMAAAPNVSRNNQPIDFLVNLDAPARMELSLFTLAGEKVYGAQAQGNAGMNTLGWNLSDNSGGPAASGLYLFYLRVVGGDGSVETRVGKVLVIH